MAEYIEREKAYEKCGWYNTVNGKSICAARKDELAAIPAADVAPVRHGRWYLTEEGDLECSNCKNLTAICECGEDRTYRKPFCPNCGAKMEVDHEDD